MARNPKSPIANDILRRVKWLYFIFLFLGVAIFARVLWIQYGPQGAELREKAKRITFERVAIEAERGDILASDGRILATSVPTYEIRMDFAAAGLADSLFNKEVDSLARCLARFFGDKSAASYKTMLTNARSDKRSNRYKLISPRRVDHLEEKVIRQFPIFRYGPNKGGYIKVKVNRRLLPHGSLAERTIGMVNSDGVKLGIEGAFDEPLRGIDGSTMMQRVSGSFRIPVRDPMNIEPVNGMDIVTTIDVDIQDVAETALKEQLERGNADWGTVVLMEVATGEIHAMANITRRGPGNYREDFNYAIGRRIEPGSTFKLATLIALLEDAGMSLDEEIDCENGKAWVGRRTVTDDHKEGVISLRRVFEVSSNIGFAKAVNDHYGAKPGRFVDFVSNMGFGQPLGIQIAGEQTPLIKHPDNKETAWDGTTLVMMSYGYALEITPMHTLALYNAVANNGKMMRPKLVKEIQNYGQTVEKFDDEVINKAICSKKTLQLVRDCLEGVVDEGTGRGLKNDNYTVAAKTGTAQIAFDRGGYTDSRGGRNYLATMVGYFPADNPKYSIIIAIKTYHGPGNRNTYYGASLSGPVFKKIADRVYARNTGWHDKVDDTGRAIPAEAKSIKGGRTEELKTVASKLSVPIKVERNADPWVYINPGEVSEPPSATARAGRAAGNRAEASRLDPESEQASPERPLPTYTIETKSFDNDTVPDVRGMSLKDAIFLLESHGMRVSYTGRGKVAAQSVQPGTKTIKGQSVQLRLTL